MSYLDTYFGQLDAALADPAVMELAINADGTIWVERSEERRAGRVCVMGKIWGPPAR